jgi:hypothetical protein
MEIKCTAKELKELIENKEVTPVALSTGVTIKNRKTILHDFRNLKLLSYVRDDYNI